MITENLSTLKIHRLTQEQYDRELEAGRIDENAIYLTPDEEIDMSIYATVEQLNEKANTIHTHEISDIANLQSTLDEKASTSHNHDSAYDVKGAANSALTEAKAYADTVGNTVKNDLLNGADTAYDTLKELGDLINENVNAIDALETIASGKADAVHTHTVSNISDLTATASELNYMEGATSNIQTQLDKKAGLKTLGMTYTDADGNSYTCSNGEVFNIYTEQITLNESGVPTNGNLASGDQSHAEGENTTASGYRSHAEGGATTASGYCSHSEGGDSCASGACSHAEGGATKAVGDYSHSEGVFASANGYASHAEGANTNAAGDQSHAEGGATTAGGSCSHAEGNYTVASGACSHAEGFYATASGDCSHAEGVNTTALAYQHAQGHFNNTVNATEGISAGTSTDNKCTAFVIGNGTSSSASNAFRITYSGKPYAKSTLTTTGADYAEFFEWQDLNPNAEDRRGYFVTLDGDKIKIAEPNDYILGIISGMPSVVGNGDEDWLGRYVFDEFGAFVYENFEYKVEIPEQIQEEVVDEETGKTTNVTKTVMKTVTKIGTKYKENPNYDPTISYIHREDRPEWDAVGMLGVLSVRDDGTCKINGYCKVAEGGIATASETGYRVIKRVNDNIVKVIFR